MTNNSGYLTIAKSSSGTLNDVDKVYYEYYEGDTKAFVCIIHEDGSESHINFWVNPEEKTANFKIDKNCTVPNSK